MTPEQEIARRKRLVSAAKALLSLQVGMGVGCFNINRCLHFLGQKHRDDFPIFNQFLSAALDYPIGNERLKWAFGPLLELDQKLARVEHEFRARILESCIVIITAYGQ